MLESPSPTPLEVRQEINQEGNPLLTMDDPELEVKDLGFKGLWCRVEVSLVGVATQLLRVRRINCPAYVDRMWYTRI